MALGEWLEGRPCAVPRPGPRCVCLATHHTACRKCALASIKFYFDTQWKQIMRQTSQVWICWLSAWQKLFVVADTEYKCVCIHCLSIASYGSAFACPPVTVASERLMGERTGRPESKGAGNKAGDFHIAAWTWLGKWKWLVWGETGKGPGRQRRKRDQRSWRKRLWGEEGRPARCRALSADCQVWWWSEHGHGHLEPIQVDWQRTVLFNGEDKKQSTEHHAPFYFWRI